MVRFTIKNHSGKTCIDYNTIFPTKSFANGLVMRFSNEMYQLGTCGFCAVIRHSDVAEVKE